MIVNRRQNNDNPPTLTIYLRKDDSTGAAGQENVALSFSSKTGEAKAPVPADGETTITIEMRNQHSSNILQQFIEKTGAVQVRPTPQEKQELDDLEERNRRWEVTKAKNLKISQAKLREKAALAQAKSEAAAFKASAA